MINQKYYDLRPVTFNRSEQESVDKDGRVKRVLKKHEARFHGWGNVALSDGSGVATLAIIERENGAIEMLDPTEITFTDLDTRNRRPSRDGGGTIEELQALKYGGSGSKTPGSIF